MTVHFCDQKNKYGQEVLFYDFNSPPDHDEIYWCLPSSETHGLGDPVLFGVVDDDVIFPGRVDVIGEYLLGIKPAEHPDHPRGCW